MWQSLYRYNHQPCTGTISVLLLQRPTPWCCFYSDQPLFLFVCTATNPHRLQKSMFVAKIDFCKVFEQPAWQSLYELQSDHQLRAEIFQFQIKEIVQEYKILMYSAWVFRVSLQLLITMKNSQLRLYIAYGCSKQSRFSCKPACIKRCFKPSEIILRNHQSKVG